MNITKDQIIKGVVNYAKNEVVNNIPNKSVRMGVAAAVKALELVPSVADSVFNNALVSAFLHEENGTYNLDDVYTVLTATMEEYGDFPLVLPFVKVPILFNSRDVRSLKEYIERTNES